MEKNTVSDQIPNAEASSNMQSPGLQERQFLQTNNLKQKKSSLMPLFNCNIILQYYDEKISELFLKTGINEGAKFKYNII